MLPLPILSVLALVILVGTAFLIAWSQSQGCLTTFVRLLAFLIGAIAPLALLWQRQSAMFPSLFKQFSLTSLTSWGPPAVLVGGVVVALILGANAVTLAATGWQTLLQQRRSKDIEKQVDLSIFNPLNIIGSSGSHSSNSGSDDLAGCLLGILIGLVGGLFWLGIQLGQAIAKQGLPSPTRQNPNRAGRAALSFVYTLIVYACLVGLLFGVRTIIPVSALELNTSSPAEMEISQMSVSSVTLEEVPRRLDTLWKQLDQGSGVAWKPAYSPLFPSEWPPTPKTFWTRYAFAYGQDFPNPTLADGQRVSRFWARLEFHPASTGYSAVIVPLQDKLEAWQVQGVQPLDVTAADTLSKEALVSDYCLRLTSLPDPDSSETAAMQAFYRTWVKYNGAIATEITPRHPDFVTWVGQ